MSRPRVLAALAVWLAVVVGASTLVWAVISRSGDDLMPSAQPAPATSHESSGARRTWQGSAGLVVATCDRGEIRLVSAQPSSGFHAEVKGDGPDQLLVEFETRAGRGRGEVYVVARCASGIPVFVSETYDE